MLGPSLLLYMYIQLGLLMVCRGESGLSQKYAFILKNPQFLPIITKLGQNEVLISCSF